MATTVRATLDRLAFGRPTVTTEPEAWLAPRPATALAGRIFLSLIFVLSGTMKLVSFDHVAQMMAAQGIPIPEVMLVLAASAEILGGLSIATGVLTRLGAIVLVAYLVPVTLIMHAFWAFDGVERTSQMAHFMKNLAIAGGLLQLIAFGGGRYAGDHKIHHD